MATQEQLAVLMQQTMQTSTSPLRSIRWPRCLQRSRAGRRCDSFQLSAFGFRLSAVWLSASGRWRPTSSFLHFWHFGILAFWSDMRGAPNNRCSDTLEAIREERASARPWRAPSHVSAILSDPGSSPPRTCARSFPDGAAQGRPDPYDFLASSKTARVLISIILS